MLSCVCLDGSAPAWKALEIMAGRLRAERGDHVSVTHVQQAVREDSEADGPVACAEGKIPPGPFDLDQGTIQKRFEEVVSLKLGLSRTSSRFCGISKTPGLAQAAIRDMIDASALDFVAYGVTGSDLCGQRGAAIGSCAWGIITNAAATSIIATSPKLSAPRAGKDCASFVVAVDGSPPSLRAYSAAMRLAAPGDTVTILHVRCPVPECDVSGVIEATFGPASSGGRGGTEGGRKEEEQPELLAAEPELEREDGPLPVLRIVDMLPGGVGATIEKFCSRQRSAVHFLAMGATGRSAAVMGIVSAKRVGAVTLHCLDTAKCAIVLPQGLTA